MKSNYDSLYKLSTSSEAGVYACSQGMFEENNLSENKDVVNLGNYDVNKENNIDDLKSSEAFGKNKRFNLVSGHETSESKELIILNKIMKEKNIWISEQLQAFLLNYNSEMMSNIIKDYDFNLLPNEKNINRFDTISDIFYKPELLTSDACKYLIPFMSIGNGDHVVVYKDDSIIYYNHDGKKVFEKLNYKDLNDFCNSFLLDKNQKRFESNGTDISNIFIKKKIKIRREDDE